MARGDYGHVGNPDQHLAPLRDDIESCGQRSRSRTGAIGFNVYDATNYDAATGCLCQAKAASLVALVIRSSPLARGAVARKLQRLRFSKAIKLTAFMTSGGEKSTQNASISSAFDGDDNHDRYGDMDQPHAVAIDVTYQSGLSP